MHFHRKQSLGARRIPTRALVVVPILTALLSNADVIFLAVARPRTESVDFAIAMTTIISVGISLGGSGLTLWFLLQLRRELDRRAEAEKETSDALRNLEKALDRERMLRRELDHRVRNNLSALLGLVSMYEGSETPLADVTASLSGKIITLRESYNLIAATHGEGIELSDLLRAVVVALLGGQTAAVTIEGPSVRLTSREANAFAMITQELITNAGKHGALRHNGGSIGVSWQCTIRNNEARVALRWIEQPVGGEEQPLQGGGRGMGLTLIQGLAESDLRGNVTFSKQSERWIVELTGTLKIPTLSPVGTRMEAHT